MENFSFSLGVWQFLLIVIVLFWVYCLYDIMVSKFRGNEKLLWLLIVIFTPPIGILFYLMVGRKAKIQDKESFEN